MKRFHIHVSVDNLKDSVTFYSTLFDTPPAVQHSDYAKWMLNDPLVNFAISTRGQAPKVDHMGIQVDSESELHEIANRLKQAEQIVLDEGRTTCCYARSDKAWVLDPQGIAWESFFTVGESTVYGENQDLSMPERNLVC